MKSVLEVSDVGSEVVVFLGGLLLLLAEASPGQRQIEDEQKEER